MKASFLNAELMRLHDLIRKKSTGTPAELARKLRCSERSVYHKIERLKDYNLPVIYDTLRQSYCYTRDVSIVFNILIDGEAMAKLKGGSHTLRMYRRLCPH
ncbi:HTH domain-containing protein [Taibaiella koreensis]|uniref:HTH domain-containing protein n=1 Tax=Taibaiella koreensis TaxID=1268548 RepID=UPI000E59D554|nr:HTH domain-containing protein [Taibaiella koreensis]